MRITPLDVRKQEFNKSMRGFDCDEVHAFLHTLADEYEAVLIDNKEIRERILEQDDKIAEYTDLEKTLRDTLMTAERVMQDTKETATKKGELIVQEAELKAKTILEECRIRTEELRREIIGLRQEKENYLGRFRSLAQAQIQFIDTHESDFEEMDKRLLDIVDNVVVKVTPESGAAPSIPAPLPVSQMTAPVATDFQSPMVAPAPTPAPVSNETDVWRDYDAGAAATTENAGPGEAIIETPDTTDNDHESDVKISNVLSESPIETENNEAAEAVDFVTNDVVATAEEKEEAHEPLSV